MRDERAQAGHLATTLRVLDRELLWSSTVYTFVSPDSPRSTDPRQDMDMASYAAVKAVRRDHPDPASPYRWGPKLACRAIARQRTAR